MRYCLKILGSVSDDGEGLAEAAGSHPESVAKIIEPSIDLSDVARIGFTLIAMYAASWLLSIMQHWVMSTVTQRVSKQMRSDISKKINRLPMWYYNKTSTGDVLSRVTNDVDTIAQSLNQSLSTLVSSLIMFFGSLIIMLITNGWMTLTAVTASLLGFVLMFAIIGRSQKYFLRQQSCLGNLNGHIEEIYSGHIVVKAYNGEDEAGKTFDELNSKLYESGKTKKLEKVSGAVEFDHVRFGYEDSDSVIIHDFSAVAKPGQKVAIVGPTGAGKTTIVNLLMRFNENRAEDPGGYGQADGEPHILCHSAPAVDHKELRSHTRPEERRYHRERHSRRAACQRRLLRRSLQQPVRSGVVNR